MPKYKRVLMCKGCGNAGSEEYPLRPVLKQRIGKAIIKGVAVERKLPRQMQCDKCNTVFCPDYPNKYNRHLFNTNTVIVKNVKQLKLFT